MYVICLQLESFVRPFVMSVWLTILPSVMYLWAIFEYLANGEMFDL